MKILIAPYAAKLPDNKKNAKDFPSWNELVAWLTHYEHEVIQIGKLDEPRIDGVSQYIVNWPLAKLEQLARDVDCYITVDSFWPHFIRERRIDKPCIVLWSQSDPIIWGYPQHINLLKSRSYLRPFQYAPWWDAEYNADAFVSPNVVMEKVHEISLRLQ